MKTAFTNSDQSLTSLKRENEDLKKRCNEMENRLAMVSQELERLGLALKTKQDEAAKLDGLWRNQGVEL